MADQVTNLKVRFTGDVKPFKKEVEGGKEMVKQFAGEGTSAIEKFASHFGINTSAIRSSLGSFSNALGSMTAGFRGAGTASGFLSTALKVLKTALIATGIGALVVALGTLIAYFTKTQRGSDKLKETLAGFKAIFNVLIDRLAAFGEGLFKILTGKFKEGWEGLKNSIKGVGEEIREETKAARELERAHQALQDREIGLIETQAKRRKEIAQLRLDERDLEKTAEERVKALNKAIALEKQYLADEMSMQKERVRILESQIALSESTREEYRQLAEEKAKIHELEEKSINFQRELASRINRVNQEIAKQREELIKLRREGLGEILDVKFKSQFELKPNIDLESLKDMSDIIDRNNQKFRELSSTVREMTQSITGELEMLVGDSIKHFADYAGALAAGKASFSDFGRAMLGSLGDAAIQVGQIAIEMGVAMLGIQQALRFGGPWAAIAAGFALVALGQAVKGSLASVVKGGATGAGAYSGQQLYDTRTFRGDLQTQKIEVEVTGQFVQRGSDLVATIKKENTRKTVIS